MSEALARWIGLCVRHAWVVLLAALLLAGGCVWLAKSRLSVSTDTSRLFSKSLPWRQHGMELTRAFPQNEDLLVAVVDGATPEEAEATAASLAAALQADKAHFKSVRQPDVSPYLERNAFLFLDRPQLSALLDQTIDAQPFLGQLAADPSLRGLFGALSLIADGVQVGQVTSGGFSPSLQQPIAMAYVDAALAVAGTPLELDNRGRRLSAKVVPMPFVPHRYYRGAAK